MRKYECSITHFLKFVCALCRNSFLRVAVSVIFRKLLCVISVK